VQRAAPQRAPNAQGRRARRRSTSTKCAASPKPVGGSRLSPPVRLMTGYRFGSPGGRRCRSTR
jgi:hypothetical protein